MQTHYKKQLLLALSVPAPNRHYFHYLLNYLGDSNTAFHLAESITCSSLSCSGAPSRPGFGYIWSYYFIIFEILGWQIFSNRETFSNCSDSTNVFSWPIFPLSRFILLNVLIIRPHGSPSSPAFSFSYWTVASELENNISDSVASLPKHKYPEVMMKAKPRKTRSRNIFKSETPLLHWYLKSSLWNLKSGTQEQQVLPRATILQKHRTD